MADDLIHEIEESIHQERLEKLWKEYGSYLIAAIVLVVLATALVSGWRSWNSKVNTSQTTAMIEALEKEDKVAALDQIIQGLRPSQRAIAHLTAAGLLLRDGEQEAALEHYTKTASNKDIKPVFRDLAQLMAVRLEWGMDSGEAQSSPQVLLARLKPVWSDKKSPWRHHAHLQAAMILAHANGDYNGAREHLTLITTAEGVPQSLAERARSLAHVYALKMDESASAEIPAETAQEEPEG